MIPRPSSMAGTWILDTEQHRSNKSCALPRKSRRRSRPNFGRAAMEASLKATQPLAVTYEPMSSLPPDLAAWLPARFVAGFCMEPGFVGLGEGFEKTRAVLRSRFESPALVAEALAGGVFLCMLRFQAADFAVWGIVDSQDAQELFPAEELYASLPPIFRTYYQCFTGLQRVLPGGHPALGWKDLPSTYSGRREMSDYASHASLTKSSSKQLYARFESKSLKLWMETNSGDLFFADEFNVRGQLFHCPANNFSAASLVSGPSFLDDYVAWVVGGNAIEQFGFDAYLKAVDF